MRNRTLRNAGDGLATGTGASLLGYRVTDLLTAQRIRASIAHHILEFLTAEPAT